MSPILAATFFIFTGVGSTALPDHTQPKIIGGWDVSQEQFPYQVSLRGSGWTMPHFCGGSVIDERHVLTAAHCVYGKKPEDIKVIVGDIMLDRSHCTSVKRHVAAIFMNEAYDQDSMANDVAVIRVSKRFPIDSPHIKKIELARRTPELDTDCTVSGWGITTYGVHDLPNHLQAVDVSLITYENCSSTTYKYGNTLSEGMICAGGIDVDSCQGDSGGPLQCNGTLVGVVSWGHQCALEGYPGVYTEVSYFYDWIQTTLLSS